MCCWTESATVEEPVVRPAPAPVAPIQAPAVLPTLPLSPSLEAQAIPEQPQEEVKEAEENPCTDTSRMKTIEVHTSNNVADISQQLLTRVINYPAENTIRFIVYRNSQGEFRVEISTTNGPMQLGLDTLQSVMKDVESSVEWFEGEEERQKQEETALTPVADIPASDRWVDTCIDYTLAAVTFLCVGAMWYFMIVDEMPKWFGWTARTA